MICAPTAKAQQAGPSVTNKNARKEMKAERKRENGRRRMQADNKDMANPQMASDRKLPKRKKKKDPKSEDEKKPDTAADSKAIRNPEYSSEPAR